MINADQKAVDKNCEFEKKKNMICQVHHTIDIVPWRPVCSLQLGKREKNIIIYII